MFSFGIPSAHVRTSLLDQHNAMAALSFLFLIILATASLVNCANQASKESCFPAEKAALLSFKAGITGDPVNLLTSWRQGHHDCCQWSGVTCSSRTGHIIKLDLRNKSPTFKELYGGVKDPKSHSLRGQVSLSLLALRRLRYLDLSMNTYLGDAMAMPGFLGSLKSLKYLNLSSMGFNGIIPPQLGNLSKLVHLDIGKEYSYNYQYSKDISWLARLRSLEHLNMASVDLSGVHDWFHMVNALPNLVVLALGNCGLNMSNAQSSLLHHNLTVLEELDLSGNPLNSLAAPNWFWDVISLKSLNLEGCELSGTFPDELGNLTLLENFDISYNYINGMMPGTLQNMCNLTSLDLSGNNISGDIREVIDSIPSCSWKNLQELKLIGVNISGMTLQFVSNLSNLRMLEVSENQLSGSVPVEIGMLTNLSYIDLSNNNLSGSLPTEIGTLTKLTHLHLGHNNFSGSLPAEIGVLTKLTNLLLSNNNLSGVISEDHFAGLVNLKGIDMSSNNLKFVIDSHWVPPFNLEIARFSSCYLGPKFPKWLRWQKGIKELDISDTCLVGRIPNWFWTTFSEASTLDISLNQLTGELPPSLEFMSVFMLSMQSNLLTGLIPKLSRTIEVLDISRNSLSGFVQNFRAPQLQVAVLFSNSITGTIPMSICRLQKLLVLDLSNNLLSKELPDCGRRELEQWIPSNNNSSRVNSTTSFSLKITTLLLSNNSLSSGFPLFLRHCASLRFLDLAQNKFTGELPRWISEAMPRLVMLRLRSNNFSGHIPNELTALQVVRILDLSNNKFSGAIPQYLKQLKGLYSDSFSEVIKGQVLEYRENTPYLITLDLSCNSLTGKIPNEISSLAGLINLNLSSNLLSGNIPDKIGNLRSVESLDLSKNRLGGGIPQSITNLTYLSYLNLSYNNLSGRIPSGHQLDILKADDPASMYIGNPGLCGDPVPRQCPGSTRDPPTSEDSTRWSEDVLFQMDFLLGSIVGFVVGTWTVFCGLLFMKRWRYAYFGQLDQLYDRLYVISVVTWRKWFMNTDGN
ncbi:receptor-like protein EIX1 [Lolium rigidum]|uniref:receptor-like protein EIX1 n=1 Tax=Lolium rigidum TaxID=89674 RepID=UPI001F5CA912|nr:receptor-like protein EIX1 [Lolium rigidum]